MILKTILHPVIRLVSTTRFIFPSGCIARSAVATKFVDAVYVVALRIGCEMTRRHLAVPSLQRFFLTFDKAFGRPGNQHAEGVNTVSGKVCEAKKDSPLRYVIDNSNIFTFKETSREFSLQNRMKVNNPENLEEGEQELLTLEEE